MTSAIRHWNTGSDTLHCHATRGRESDDKFIHGKCHHRPTVCVVTVYGVPNVVVNKEETHTQTLTEKRRQNGYTRCLEQRRIVLMLMCVLTTSPKLR